MPLEENTFRWNDREIAERRHQSANMRRAVEGRGRMYDGRTGGGVTAFLHQLMDEARRAGWLNFFNQSSDLANLKVAR